MNISTVVNNKRTEYNDLHKRSYTFLTPSGEKISEGKTKRLLAYAIKRMNESGFPCFENVEISTNEYDFTYSVAFQNEKGGKIAIDGIFLNRGGHPFIDHGFSIEA
ncbi:hypothetical protein [Planktothrix paucivesiculata]|uniref:Uncharacterized protein n=1 Tax=Planktothrix paucivesiculata PCC 9631 TaxID=671071 RepID=A0A7Z9E071_9CYAN|nr:hypothetical protein [Planktothrix paucivesiculata]VXD15944.1 hypothetical protein PL9631_180004 [Planktothrix paucivesiculata PCC 9631]